MEASCAAELRAGSYQFTAVLLDAGARNRRMAYDIAGSSATITSTGFGGPVDISAPRDRRSRRAPPRRILTAPGVELRAVTQLRR